jgi:hypothetical protein
MPARAFVMNVDDCVLEGAMPSDQLLLVSHLTEEVLVQLFAWPWATTAPPGVETAMSFRIELVVPLFLIRLLTAYRVQFGVNFALL